MRRLLAVLLGGALGGACRVLVELGLVQWAGWTQWLATSGINGLGALLLGLGLVWLGPEGRWPVSEPLRQGVLAGGLGSFTTLSLLSVQTLLLIDQGQWLLAGLNGLGSLLLAVAAVGLGLWVGERWRRPG